MVKSRSEHFNFVSALKLSIANSQCELRQRQDASLYRGLLYFVATLVLAAGILYIALGYQAGFSSVNHLSYDMPVAFLQILTFLGDTSVGLVLILPFVRRHPAILVVTLFAAVYGCLISHGMKVYFNMPRPPAVLEMGSFFQTGDVYKMGSFPSGHSLSIFTVVTIFYYFARTPSTRVLLLAVGGCVALSRVLVGAHWPIDVLIGSALGVVIALAAVQTAKRAKPMFNLGVHFFVLSLLLISAFYLFGHDGGYPAAKPFAMTLSAVILIQFLYDFVYCGVLGKKWALAQ